jgi:hypothetical protein
MHTRAGLLASLRVNFPDWLFAMREPREYVYDPPETLWQRVLQLVRGPKLRARMGEVEIAVTVPSLPVEEDEVHFLQDILHHNSAAGVRSTTVFYER